MTLGIYDAAFSELKGKDSVEFSLIEQNQVGEHLIALKNGYIKNYNILISDEDDIELCRNEIREFLKKEGICPSNIDRKFSIV